MSQPIEELIARFEKAASEIPTPEYGAARSALQEAFAKLERDVQRFRDDIDRGYSNISKTQQRYREAARTETERRGFKEGELQWLWRGPDCLKRKYNQGEMVAAICDALTREGCTAWPGDGTSCVEQIVRLQWERAERAEAELRSLRLQLAEESGRLP